jgi:hypothetical protein
LVISKGATDFNNGLKTAASGGHLNLINLFLEKGATNMNYGLHGAAKFGDPKLIEFFISKGANDWIGALIGAARGGHLELVKHFIKLCEESNIPINWNAVLYNTIYGNNLELIPYIISRGANDLNYAMALVIMSHNIRDKMKIINYLIKAGFNNWGYAITISEQYNKNLVYFFSKFL